VESFDSAQRPDSRDDVSVSKRSSASWRWIAFVRKAYFHFSLIKKDRMIQGCFVNVEIMIMNQDRIVYRQEPNGNELLEDITTQSWLMLIF
jgi:hypothetical protein